MASQNYNDDIIYHIQNIDEVQLNNLLNKVDEFTRLYKKQTNVKPDKENIEETKKLRSQIEQFAKQQSDFNKRSQQIEKDNKKEQQKSADVLKSLSEFTDKQSGSLQDLLKSFDAYEKSTSEKLKEQVAVLKQGNDDYLSTQDKLRRDAQKLKKENEKKTTQEKLELEFEHKAYRFQSEYYKDARKKLNYLSQGLKDFRNNPKAFILDAMGNVMGKAFDKSIQVLASSFKSIAQGITDGLKDSFDSFFNAIESSRESSEDIAKSTGRSFEVSQKSLDKVQTLTFQLLKQGDKTAQYAADYQKDIAEFLQKNYGENWETKLEPDQIENLIKRLGVAFTNNVDVKEIAKYNNKIEDMLNVLTYETDIKGALLRLPEKLESTVAAGLIDINDRNLRMSKQQAIDLNKSLGLFNAQMAQNNDDFNERASGAIKDLVSGISQMTDIGAILNDQQVQSLQGYGVDLKSIQRMIQQGSDKERAEAIRMLGKAAANEHLAPVFESIGLLHGGQVETLKNMKFESNEDVQTEWNKSAIDEGAVGYKSKVSEMKMERDLFFNAIKSMRQQAAQKGEDVTDTAMLLTGMESLLDDSQKQLIGQLSYEQQDKILKLVREGGSGEGLSDEEKNFYNILTENNNDLLNHSEELLKDLGAVAEQATRMNNLGLDKALSQGGINGLLGKVFELSTSSTFSPTQKKELTEFLKGIGTTLKPLFNVLYDVLISPVIDSIQDTVGQLLGEILAAIKGWWKGDKYTEEERYLDQTKFLKSSNNVYSDKEKIDNGEGAYSDDYKKAIENINNLEMSDVDKMKNLTSSETIALKRHIAANSKPLNTGGQFQGSDEITEVDLSTDFAKQSASNWMNQFKIDLKKDENGNISADAPQNINDFINYINESDDVNKTLEFLGADKEVDKSKLKAVYNVLNEQGYGGYGYKVANDSDVGKLYNLFGIDKSIVWDGDDLRAFIAYELVKGNVDLFADRNWNNTYLLRPHNGDKFPNHVAEAINKWGSVTDDDYRALSKGGVVEEQKGGTKAILGEAGFDEIVIPTDPDKDKYAQKLLQIAKDKYGVYLKDPETVSDKLSSYVSILGRAARMLMLQLDPLKDVMAYNYIMQAFGMLGMIGKQQLQNKLMSTTTTGEELTGTGLPMKGTPIENAPSIDSIRNAIIEKAKEAIGTPYKEAPNGFVCNELVNFAYGSVLGAGPYKELLNNAGYDHDRMHTISGFINEVGKNGFKGKLASSVPYSELTGLAKPGDLVFSSNTGKTKSTYNPDNHGHVNLYIDPESKIDSTSVVRNGKDGVGVHQPGKGNHMLINILDLMPQEWYVSKGLIKEGTSNNNIIGMNADGSPIYASSYDPSIQSIPNASTVETYVSKADQAKIEKEKLKSEKENAKTQGILKKMVEILKMTNDKKALNNMLASFNEVPQSEGFCTVPSYTKTTVGFSGSAR